MGDAFKHLAQAAKNTVSDGIETVIEKAKEIDVSDAFDKVKDTTAAAYEKAKDAGEAVVTATQKHAPSSEEIQEKAAKITESGHSFLKSAMSKILK